VARTAIVLLAAAAALTGDQTVTVGPELSFSPATVTVAPGEAVIWDFQASHTSTSDAMAGPEVWNSGVLSSGTFSHTFQTPGTYPYYCAVHSFPGGTMMNAVVQVKGAGATATPTPLLTPTPDPTVVPPTPTSTPAPTAIPTEPVPTLTPPASPTPTPLPPATPGPPPTSAPGPAPAGIPLLDPLGRILLAIALGAAGIAALSFAGRR
jgi:plastocyanin